MGMALSQQLKQTQRLIMTPQMQQSIQLLQMNAMELEELTREEMLENPFLETQQEETDPSSGAAEADAADNEPAKAEAEEPDITPEPIDIFYDEAGSQVEAASTASDKPEVSDDPIPPDPEIPPDSTASTEDASEEFAPGEDLSGRALAEVDTDWKEVFDDDEPYMPRAIGSREQPEEEKDFTEYTASKIGLHDHLQWQLESMELDETTRAIAGWIINSLNDDGYLLVSDDAGGNGDADKPSILTQDPAEAVRIVAGDLGTSEEAVLKGLRVVQSFDPPGVGARNLAECLTIQLRDAGVKDPLPFRILNEQFDLFLRRRTKELSRALGVKEEDIARAVERIARLEPRPGRKYSTDTPHYVRPDVYVKEVDGRYIYYLNEGDVGRLRINDYYRNLMRNHSATMTDKEREYALEKYKSALWLIKNIEKRKSTILTVTEAIMEYQKDFLERGVEGLKPLTLKVIADQVGMHESTIARVTNSKYVETPRGVFSLKFFFSSSLETDDGESASSRSIKETIREIIAAEDPARPISDQRISAILSQRGVRIARRTVAKYREQLKILPAKMRKSK